MLAGKLQLAPKNRANLLETDGRLACLLFTCVADHDEIRAARFEPGFVFRAGQGTGHQSYEAEEGKYNRG